MNAAADLRPRGVAELVDRAVTVYVRNSVLFTSILLFLYVPVGIAQYFVEPDSGAIYATLARDVSAQSAGDKHAAGKIAKDLDAQSKPGAQQLVLVLVILLLAPFATVAVAIGVARLQFGEPASWRTCWGASLQRWPRILGITVLELLALTVSLLAGVLGLTLFSVLGVVVLRSIAPLGILIIVLAFILFLVWFLLFVMQAALSFSFGIYAVAIENAGILSAFGSSYARVFNAANFWRGLLIALVMMAVEFGILIVSVIVEGVLGFFVHIHALNAVFQLAASIVLAGFVIIFAATYYFDVRTRAEGLDLAGSLRAAQGVLGIA